MPPTPAPPPEPPPAHEPDPEPPRAAGEPDPLTAVPEAEGPATHTDPGSGELEPAVAALSVPEPGAECWFAGRVIERIERENPEGALLELLACGIEIDGLELGVNPRMVIGLAELEIGPDGEPSGWWRGTYLGPVPVNDAVTAWKVAVRHTDPTTAAFFVPSAIGWKPATS